MDKIITLKAKITQTKTGYNLDEIKTFETREKGTEPTKPDLLNAELVTAALFNCLQRRTLCRACLQRLVDNILKNTGDKYNCCVKNCQ